MPEVDTLLITCKCGQRMKVPAEAVGKTTACVKCGERIRIAAAPGSGNAPEAADSPAQASPRKRLAAPAPAQSNGADTVTALQQEGLITEGQVREARLIQQDLPAPIWEVLIDIGHLTADAFHKFVSDKTGATAINLENYNIPTDVVEFVPEDIVIPNRVFPVDKLGKLLTLAMACPTDHATVQQVEERTGLRVKVMSCRLDQLRQTTRTFFPERSEADPYDDALVKELRKEFDPVLKVNEVARRVYNLESLPVLDHTEKRLHSLFKEDDPALDALIDIISQDPILTGPVLALANTSAYGFGMRVDSLGLAVSLVGSEGVKAAVRALGARDYFGGDAGGTFKTVWRRSQFCAEASRTIADTIDSQRGEAARVAGLLSEIGRIALPAVLPKSYLPLADSLAGDALIKQERRLYHFDHAEAGYMLARLWNLPSGVCEPIRYVRKPADAPRSREVVNIVALALLLTDAHQNDDFGIVEDAQGVLKSLKLNPARAKTILNNTIARFPGN